MKPGGVGHREAATLSAAQLKEEADSLECCMATGVGGLGWAWCPVRVNERARLQDQLVTSILFSTLEVGEGHRVMGPESQPWASTPFPCPYPYHDEPMSVKSPWG